jgi:hypothetical protein
MRSGSFAGLVCLPILLVHSDLAAQVETDVNIATGLDISASVGRDEEWLERVGTARGLASQPFAEAALSGRHSRVGVAVFAWSSRDARSWLTGRHRHPGRRGSGRPHV